MLFGAVEVGPLEFFPHAEGFPSFRAGDRALLFLERTADRDEFRSLAARFPWFSAQGAGQEWILPPDDAGVRILEVARRLASHRAQRPTDPTRALRDVVLAELASGVPRLRRDAIAELVTARLRPGLPRCRGDALVPQLRRRRGAVRPRNGSRWCGCSTARRASTRAPASVR